MGSKSAKPEDKAITFLVSPLRIRGKKMLKKWTLAMTLVLKQSSKTCSSSFDCSPLLLVSVS